MSEHTNQVVTSDEFVDWVAELQTERGTAGAPLLADVETFLARFVAYPSEAARVAHVLWIAHTWLMDEWDSTPRIAFLSPEPGSGKSRALEVTEPLVPRPVHAVNTTPAYLFRKVSDPDGAPTILYDEIDTVFGPKAKDNEDVRGMLNAGHRQGAMAGRCVIKGRNVVTEELPAYCAVALAGLDDLPDTIMTRSVVVRMRRRAPNERVEPWRLRLNGPEAEELGDQLRAWANEARFRVRWPDMPAGVEDRDADVWESLLAIADLAGEEWPERARRAAVELVTSNAQRDTSLGVLLLRDLRTVFGAADRLTTDVILERLQDLDESPWADLRGKPIDARGLARRLSKYGVKPTQYRDEHGKQRGYLAADLADPWTRYLPESVPDSGDAVPVHLAESVRENPPVTCDVPAVPAVPAKSGDGSAPSTDTTNYVSEVPPRGMGERGGSPESEPAPLFPQVSGTSGTPVRDAPASPDCVGCGKRLAPPLIKQGWTRHPSCEGAT